MSPEDISPFQIEFDDFFEQTSNGFLILDSRGTVLRANARFAGWIGLSAEEITGKRFSQFFSVGGRILYETHLAPMLKMQGYFDEMALEVAAQNGERLPVFVSGFEARSQSADQKFTSVTVSKAVNRRAYEESLRLSKINSEDLLAGEREVSVIRSRFIAVLGHDLRNPLSAISMATSVLESADLDKDNADMVRMIKQGTDRMADLISDVLDFARGHLGSGIPIDSQWSDIKPVLHDVVKELQFTSPQQPIHIDLHISESVFCDSPRLAQLLSNLVANALTHGSADTPISVQGILKDHELELSVSNHGGPIPNEALSTLFEPFTRNDGRPSKQGLGLGLFIAFQIAIGHGGTLTTTSTTEETRFTFRMPHVRRSVDQPAPIGK